MKRIYMDYASLTPIDSAVLRVMNEYSSSRYANASSWYKEGSDADKALLSARKNVATFLRAHPDEIIFTAGGTEANNIAIIGAVEELHKEGKAYKDMQIIVSEIEHSSVLETATALSSKGVVVEKVKVSAAGIIDLNDFKKKINPNTVLVSIMMVNNEIGTIQPIREIAKVIRHMKGDRKKIYPLLHTDASQAGNYIEIDVLPLGVDLLTLDAGKMYGPRSTGCLYVRRGIKLQPIIFGGGQEKGLRSGTENIPSIMGFSKAIEIAEKNMKKESVRIEKLRDSFLKGLKKIWPKLEVNGVGEKAPHILNVSIPDIDNEYFIFELDAHGICASARSSCLGEVETSHVLNAIGTESKDAVRFSFGRETDKKSIEEALKRIKRLPSLAFSRSIC